MKYTEEAYQLTDEENLAPAHEAVAPQRRSRAGFAAALLATALSASALTYRVAGRATELRSMDSTMPVVHAYVDAM